MRVSDLAKELKTTDEAILAKLRSLKLKAKDSKQELNSAVAIVLKSEFSKSALAVALKPKETPKPAAPEVKVKPKEAVKETKEVKKTAVKGKLEIKGKEKPLKEKKAAKAPEAKTKTTVAKTTVVESKVIPAKIAVAALPPIAAAKPAAPAAPPKTPQPTAVKLKPKSKHSSEPFVSVKPLAKKRKRPMGGAPYREGGRDHHESSGGGSSDSTATLSMPSQTQPGFQGVPGSTIETSPAGKPLTDLEIKVPISVKDFSFKIQEKSSVILKKLLQMGVFANINQNLDEDVVRKLAPEFGFNLIKVKTQEEQLIDIHQVEKDDPASLTTRAPVVTFMGHVDHGKTSLIDKIRKSKVADSEHGGITQHIGAYSINLPKGRITFLDTPGHEAFTSMRARGAHITDLIVLVVAADEGVMPQTEEAIDHARAANVPIVVALNKIDKKNADIDRVKKQLADRELSPEDWGGRTVCVGVSATTGAGVDTLLEMILLEAELLELKANTNKKATGIVVEAHLSQGKGAVATLIVQNGTLKEGDTILVGAYYGRVKAMFDDRERPIQEAGPSRPVEILGLPAVPEAGEMFYVMQDERQAREIAYKRRDQLKEQKMQSYSKITLEDLYSQIQEGKIKELNVIVKADVQGSLEAIKDSLMKIPNDQVKLNFIHATVGDINASDVILAVASSAIIIGFHVEVDVRAKEELAKQPVDIRTYRIIYDAVNDVKNALEGLLEPRTRKKFLSRIEIREVFKLSRSGIVAGCYVQKGKVHRKANMDIVRNGEVVFSGTIASLKRFKDDVRDVGEGFECGITINGFNEIQPGDVIEAYELEKIARKL